MLLSIHKMNFSWMRRRISVKQGRWGQEKRGKRGNRRGADPCWQKQRMRVGGGSCECVCVIESRINQGVRRDQGRKEMTHSGGMIQQEDQNRAIISQPVVQRGVIILAPILAVAVLLSI